MIGFCRSHSPPLPKSCQVSAISCFPSVLPTLSFHPQGHRWTRGRRSSRHMRAPPRGSWGELHGWEETGGYCLRIFHVRFPVESIVLKNHIFAFPSFQYKSLHNFTNLLFIYPGGWGGARNWHNSVFMKYRLIGRLQVQKGKRRTTESGSPLSYFSECLNVSSSSFFPKPLQAIDSSKCLRTDITEEHRKGLSQIFNGGLTIMRGLKINHCRFSARIPYIWETRVKYIIRSVYYGQSLAPEIIPKRNMFDFFLTRYLWEEHNYFNSM